MYRRRRAAASTIKQRKCTVKRQRKRACMSKSNQSPDSCAFGLRRQRAWSRRRRSGSPGNIHTMKAERKNTRIFVCMYVPYALIKITFSNRCSHGSAWCSRKRDLHKLQKESHAYSSCRCITTPGGKSSRGMETKSTTTLPGVPDHVDVINRRSEEEECRGMAIMLM